MTLNMWIATFSFLVITLGVINRKKQRRHVSCMLLGIGIDISLVLYLQITKDAVQTALEMSLSLLEQVHILFSTLALSLYFPVIALGLKLLLHGGDAQTRSLHIRLALTTYIFRTLGFLFMFSMLKVS